ncbi:hypothetical protein ABZZ80_46945, partial [Streptomyces sp. NPDC006356]
QNHIPFDVLGSEFAAHLVENAALDPYAVLVLPYVRRLPPQLAESITDFVRRGGRLVVTGDPGRVPDALPASPAVELELSGMKELGGRHGARADGRFGDRLPLFGHFWGVRVPEARTRPSGWELSERAPFGPPEIAYGNEDLSGFTLLYEQDSGAGSVSVFPWTIGTSKRVSGLSSLGALLAGQVTALLGAHDELGADLPTDVEITLGAAGDSVVVHLVNHSGGRRDRVLDPQPLSGVLRLRGTFAERVTTAHSLRDDQPLAVHREGAELLVPVTVSGALEVIELA